jgi:hypothetical protein
MKKLLFACVLLALSTLPAIADDNPWVGTWKLDSTKSHFTGDTFTYSKAPNGLMHYSDGSATDFDFGIDGKEYKTVSDRTVTWTATGENAWDTVMKANGTVLASSHRQLSSDGKTLSIKSTGTRPDGSTFNNEFVYQRVTGSTGLIGKWRSTKVDLSNPEIYIITMPSPGIYRMEYPVFKETTEGKPDGTDNPVNGPTVPPNTTFSFKMVSPTKMSYVNKVDGKPRNYGVQTLAADGKSITDVSWSPGKESEKETDVLIKQ